MTCDRHGLVGVVVAMLAGTSLAAQETIRISGTVVDSATRQPVAGAIVSIRSNERLFSERTDEGGVFRMPRVASGSISAEVKRIGYERKSFTFLLNDDTTLAIVVVPAARRLVPVNVLGKGEGVYGVIGRSTDIKPIVGAKVLVVGSGVTTTTDSAGEFFVPLKHPGTYLVRVTADGYGEEVLSIIVGKNEVVESSQLLDNSDRKPLSAGLWDDFDQRLRWRPITSALVSGADLRAGGVTITEGLSRSAAMIKSALVFRGPICMFVNGQPRPGMGIDDIRVEEIRAIEVYGDQSKDEMYISTLKQMWPAKLSCATGGSAALVGIPTAARGRGRPQPTSVKWVVVWLR